MNAYQSPLYYCTSGYLSVGEIYMSYAVHVSLEMREKHTRVKYNVTQLWSGKQQTRNFILHIRVMFEHSSVYNLFYSINY